LSDYLAERRTLLSLDALSVIDSTGRVVASTDAMVAAPAAGVRVEARAPILYQGARAGEVAGSLVLDAAFLARLAQSTGIELLLLDAEGRPVATTLAPAPDVPAAGVALPTAAAAT